MDRVVAQALQALIMGYRAKRRTRFPKDGIGDKRGKIWRNVWGVRGGEYVHVCAVSTILNYYTLHS